jgi:hypothetical protein
MKFDKYRALEPLGLYTIVGEIVGMLWFGFNAIGAAATNNDIALRLCLAGVAVIVLTSVIIRTMRGFGWGK